MSYAKKEQFSANNYLNFGLSTQNYCMTLEDLEYCVNPTNGPNGGFRIGG